MKQGEIANYGSPLGKDNCKNSQGYVDVKNLTLRQIDELILRQTKLLQNRFFLEKLPDKGRKMMVFKTLLETEYKKKVDEYDDACQLLLDLRLNDENDMEEMEWNNGKLSMRKKQLDSDDDDDDEGENKCRKNKIEPLKVLASHSGTADGINVKLTLSERPRHDNYFSYIHKFCEKYGTVSNFKERFKPNQFRNNDQKLFATSANKVKKNLGSYWEITQATPPVPIYQNAVMISLSESLKLQKEQAEKLKDVEKKRAAEKLLQKSTLKMGHDLPANNIAEYRKGSDYSEDLVSEDEEDEIDYFDCQENQNDCE